MAAASESWAVGLGASGPVPMFDQGFPRGGRFQPRQRDYAWYSTGGGGNQIRSASPSRAFEARLAVQGRRRRQF